jgi:hypothetical protein
MGLLEQRDWQNLTTLDMDPNCKPDVLWDLNDLPYPFEDDSFNEIHAYDVLEHFGKQGDYKSFFAQFEEFYRISRNGCLFCITVPQWNGMWAWGDPGHTRVLPPGVFYYLWQDQYRQVGETKMTDYRDIYKGDWGVVKVEILSDENPGIAVYLIAIKATNVSLPRP